MNVLPVHSVVRPAVLAGQINGHLPDSVLVDTPGQAGGVVVRLVRPAALCWRALCAAALAAGHVLKATSVVDSYRPYEVQERTFRQRCQTTPIIGVTPRWWRGQQWYLKPGYAPVAVPGTSNHGWGLAVDTGEERDGDTGVESLDAGTLAWLVAHELDYGFSHEMQVEPWHIRCFVGDAIPPAVLNYVGTIEEGKDMAFKDDVDAWFQMYRTLGQQNMDDPIIIPDHVPSGTRGRSEPNLLAQTLRRIEATAEAVAPTGLSVADVELAVRRVIDQTSLSSVYPPVNP